MSRSDDARGLCVLAVEMKRDGRTLMRSPVARVKAVPLAANAKKGSQQAARGAAERERSRRTVPAGFVERGEDGASEKTCNEV